MVIELVLDLKQVWMKQFYLSFLFVTFYALGFGQTKTVTGTLLDFNGDPVPGKDVTVYFDSTGISGSYSQTVVTTNSSGTYSGTVNVSGATGTLYVYTLDCSSNIIQQPIAYTSASNTYTNNFNYCNTFSTLFSASFSLDSSNVPYILSSIPANGQSPYTYSWSTGSSSSSIGISQSGYYCLTITDATNASDTICRYVYIGCDVSFDISPNQTSVDYTATVEGYMPISYQWTFGDGSTSTYANPYHTFTTNDITSFQTCLEIVDAANCSTSVCDNVVVSPLGGDNTISGYCSKGITPLKGANVYLYTQIDGSGTFSLLDSIISGTNSNNFTFQHLPQHDYIIRAELPDNHTDYNNYVPTYFGNQVKWQSATSILLNSSSTNNQILFRQNNSDNGIYSISGTVIDSASNLGYEGANLFALTGNGTVKSFSASNSNGSYVLSGLDTGNYTLWVDIPGKSMTEYNLALSGNVTNLEWEVRHSYILPPDEDPTSIELYASTPLKLFPNPASDVLYWNTTEKIKQIKIIDISGKIVFVSDATILQSHIDISDLTTGLYFIQLETSNKTYTEKLIKQ
ncbi:MAG: hypothetical protein CL843_03710 [Crocinitomicaceae bacterium]|nr:hypothetical protein [Crocinitomicaceae bacterium]|tara:strand:- start:1461 stop:3173 length:1713 start_codon:yes stop_codon:yes gene_type:complete